MNHTLTKQMETTASLTEPWPNTAMARLFLRGLIQGDGRVPLPANLKTDVSNQQLAEWVEFQGLGPLVFQRYKQTYPELADQLKDSVFTAVAIDELQNQYLKAIHDQFSAHAVPVVLLKGAALAKIVYESSWLRIMDDADIWVQDVSMELADQLMGDLGFFSREKGKRPQNLQALSGGEIQFYHSDWAMGLIELHWSPFAGWWLKRTAHVDDEAVWSRIRLLSDNYYTLAKEDMVIQIAVHLAINHQFGLHALRNLLDLGLLAEQQTIDWPVVGQRAKEWRVATAVYVVLTLLQDLFTIDDVQIALDILRPSSWRLRLIRRFVSPEYIIAGRDLTTGHERYLLLLLLVDRASDVLKLIFRTLWPENEWLQARYSDKQITNWQHLWRVIRHGDI